MHIAFDSSMRLKRRVYYFEYKGIQFKLMQNNPIKYTDMLLSIVPTDNKSERQRVYATAAEFLSALSWGNKTHISLENVGGVGVTFGYSLKKCKCRMFVFPKTPFKGKHIEFGISQIPAIENDNQKAALILFREAMSSNKLWLSFLLYWQILEVCGGTPTVWINREYYEKNKVFIPHDKIQQLSLGGKKLGEYLYDDCRNAIAHIRRSQGRRAIRLDMLDDNLRIRLSTDVIKCFAEHFIISELKLNKNLYLVKKDRLSFPKYVNSSELQQQMYTLAYP